MALIDDAHLPLVAAELLEVHLNHLVRGDDDREGGFALRARRHEAAHDPGSLRLGAVVFDARHRTAAPLLDLVAPVLNRRERRDDDERSFHTDVAHESEESNHLDRLAQTHFVREDSVRPILKEPREPQHAFDLVIVQRSGQRIERAVRSLVHAAILLRRSLGGVALPLRPTGR